MCHRRTMKKILGIVLIAAGILLVVLGSRRSDSLAGVVDKTTTDIANSVDGGTRVSEQVWYYVGGAVLIVAGAASLIRRRAS